MKETITKYRKTDGRISWGYQYRWEGRQFTKSGFRTKFEASKALGIALARHQLHGARPQQWDTRNLAEYIRYWLDNHAALRCGPKTLERYRQLAESLVRLLGGVSILDLRPGVIQEAVNVLLLRGGAPTEAQPDGRPLAAKTVQSTASLLFTCLGDAARLEHIPANPMADRKVKLPKRPRPDPAVMEADALGAIFQHAHGTRLYPFVVTASVLRLPPRRTTGLDLGRSRLRKRYDDGFEKSRADESWPAGQAHQIWCVPQYWSGRLRA